jgi:hypothetical protein
MPDYQLRRWSTLGRVGYILCTVLIVFYVAFDVLDLDGSDFPTTRAPVARTVIMVEVSKVNVDVYLPVLTELWVGSTMLLLAVGLRKSFQHKTLDVLRILPLNTPRAHRYRVALPRSSVSDIRGLL